MPQDGADLGQCQVWIVGHPGRGGMRIDIAHEVACLRNPDVNYRNFGMCFVYQSHRVYVIGAAPNDSECVVIMECGYEAVAVQSHVGDDDDANRHIASAAQDNFRPSLAQLISPHANGSA